MLLPTMFGAYFRAFLAGFFRYLFFAFFLFTRDFALDVNHFKSAKN